MGSELILDTGPLVSLLDRSQQAHQACVDFYSAFEGRMVTTEAVLTESTYLLSDVPKGGPACIEFVLRSGVFIAPSTEISLARCRDLMKKYSDVPMDLADATLVVLAEELGTNLVFTLDRDFSIYRLQGRRPFRILPPT